MNKEMTTGPTPDRSVGQHAGLRLVAVTLGVGVGVSGLDHGLFEALQGNITTPGPFIQAIGPGQRMWQYGTEDAFTLVPNLLGSGILSMLLGLLVIGWSVACIGRPSGARGLLLLGLGMVLVGGGVAALGFLAVAWWAATRVERPIALAGRLPKRTAARLSRAWPTLLAAGIVLFAFALEVAIAGVVPSVTDPVVIEIMCWAALLGMLVAFVLAMIGASVAALDQAVASRPLRR